MLNKDDQIGPYTIISDLGQGGMATVYKAHHARLDRHVAIKILHQPLMKDPVFLGRFEREARIIANLDHPNIVPVHDFDDHEGKPYLVMKHVEGSTLKEALAEGMLSMDETLRIMTVIADALSYAHEQDVLHRDIKPSNIILDEKGNPWLMDFGLARMMQQGESTLSQDMIIGTPQYISPEQARGEKDLDARTDIYSLGVVLYELVVGQVPYTADTPYAIIHDQIYSPLPLPSEKNPDVSPAVETVLLKTLTKKTADRYKSVAAMMRDFRRATDPSQSAALALDRDSLVAARGSEQRAPEPTPAPLIGVPWPIPPGGDETSEERDWGQRRDWGERVETGAQRAVDTVSNIVTYVKKTIAEHDGSFEDANLTEEERARRRVEARIEARHELFRHIIAYVIVNVMIWLFWTGKIGGDFHVNLSANIPWAFEFPWPLIITLGWAIGLFSDLADYRNKHGVGVRRRERMVQRELVREQRRQDRWSGEDDFEAKRKNEDLAQVRVRLTADGELTESFVEDMHSPGKSKRQM